MPEKAVNQKLHKAKSAAIMTLIHAGYKTEKAYNQTFCVMAARASEWRIIAIGVEAIVSCPWFEEQVKRLEKYPCPNSQMIQKEVWIRGDGEHAFRQFTWKDNQWINEEAEAVDTFR